MDILISMYGSQWTFPTGSITTSIHSLEIMVVAVVLCLLYCTNSISMDNWFHECLLYGHLVRHSGNFWHRYVTKPWVYMLTFCFLCCWRLWLTVCCVNSMINVLLFVYHYGLLCVRVLIDCPRMLSILRSVSLCHDNFYRPSVSVCATVRPCVCDVC